MGSKDYSFTFNPNKRGLRKVLGDLESEIMEIVWAKDGATVRAIYEQLKTKRNIAYTTVMTVMSRLAEKGLLERKKEGAAFIYRAASSREEFTRSTVKRVINGLLRDFAAPAISQFLESVGHEHPEKIKELARLIDEKRKKK